VVAEGIGADLWFWPAGASGSGSGAHGQPLRHRHPPRPLLGAGSKGQRLGTIRRVVGGAEGAGLPLAALPGGYAAPKAALCRADAEEGDRRPDRAGEEADIRRQTGDDERQQGTRPTTRNVAKVARAARRGSGPLTSRSSSSVSMVSTHRRSAVVRYDGDDLLQGFAGEALGGEDVAHLLAFPPRVSEIRRSSLRRAFSTVSIWLFVPW
jgi:hypothetical protein